jgi:hypothetical protein
MTAKTKFEQLIEYVINDEEQKAHELFHDIVVEKSREIYENIMNEEDEEEELDEGSMDDSSGRAQEDLMHEVETDQEGSMNEEEGDDEESTAEFDDEAEEAGEEETDDIEAMGDEEAGEGGGDIEDRVVDLEDKLDELMAEFEALMGDEEVAGGDEFDMEPVDGDVGGDAEMGDDTADFTDTDVPMTEAVSLIKVAAAKMGDDGAQTKSPTRFNSGAAGMQGKPVSNTASESNPDGTAAYKAPTSYADKGRGDLKGAGNFKNVPGKNGSKLEAAPKPKMGDNGSNTRTPFPKG